MSEFVFVIFRIDYSNDLEWEIIKAEITNVDSEDLDFKDDIIYENKTIDELVHMNPSEYFFVVDSRTMKDHTLLLVDYETRHTVRFHSRNVWMPMCNLPIGNMDFEEYESIAVDGVFNL
jgi:hypothetical protein